MEYLLQSLNERIKAIGADWTKYAVVGSFLLYVLGYLALRFHLTALGVSTDLNVLDERYLFAGARFLVYAVTSVPNILLLALPLLLAGWVLLRLLSVDTRARALQRLMRPRLLLGFGLLFSMASIVVMRQCFRFSNLLLAQQLPTDPAWLVAIILDDRLIGHYFAGLIAACALTLAVLWALRGRGLPGGARAAQALLAFLAAVQLLMLPINYGVLIADKTLPSLTAVGDKLLAQDERAWLVWEGKDGVTYLLSRGDRRVLLTLPRSEVRRIEIAGFDRILRVLHDGRVPRRG